MVPFNPLRDIPDLSGKVVLVTGANRGMGYELAKHFAINGAKVYMGARSELAAREAIAEIERDNGTPLRGSLQFFHLDLGTIKGGKIAGENFLAIESRLDILVHNAALLQHPYTRNSEDIEDSMVVNHLSPQLLTETLMPVLKTTSEEPLSDVRIVTVASFKHSDAPAGGHFLSLEEMNNSLSCESRKDSFSAQDARYSRTKLANVLFAKKLQENLDEAGLPIISLSLSPGGVATESVLDFFDVPIVGGVFKWGLRTFAKTPLQGATTGLYASTAPEVKANMAFRGAYLVPYGKIASGTKDAQDHLLAQKLWNVSEEIIHNALSEV